MVNRIVNYFLWPKFRLRQIFTDASLEAIGSAVTKAESDSNAEIFISIESTLPLTYILSGKTPFDRAKDIFLAKSVSKTTTHTGVLVYVVFAESGIEILCDTAITFEKSVLDQALATFLASVKADPAQAIVALVQQLGALCQANAPRDSSKEKNEIPDKPVL